MQPMWRSLLQATACASALLSAACSSPADQALDTRAKQVVYYLSQDPTTLKMRGIYLAPDGRELAYRQHRRRADVALVYLHGIESHGGWFDHAGDLLAGRGYDVYCLDRRGSGINRENRGFTSGHIESWEQLREDVHAFMAPMREVYEHVFLVGLSWGGKEAVAYGLDHPEDADGLVLITPGLVAKVDAGLGDKLDVLVSTAVAPERGVPIPIETDMFTTDPAWIELLESDPLRLHYGSARFFWVSHAMDGMIADRIGENVLPMQLFLAGNDRIIDNPAVEELLAQGAGPGLETILYEDETHSIQFDAPERLVEDMDRWLKAQVAQLRATQVKESGS